MTPTSAVTTGAVGLGVAQIADIITWLSQWPLSAPPQNVAIAIAAAILAGAHGAFNWINRRWPAPVSAAPLSTEAAQR